MAKNDKKKTNWRDKFKFAVTNDTTFEELWRIKLTRYNAFLLVFFVVFFIIIATASLISFTNLRELIPGYPDVTMRRDILLNAIRLDSLERELALRDHYFENLNAIIAGERPASSMVLRDTTANYNNISFRSSPEDSALRVQVETESRYSISQNQVTEYETSLASLHFFPPVRGIVSGKYCYFDRLDEGNGICY